MLGIKQWWLAEQIGVDRKTVMRWIHGKVRSIQEENAVALAKILNCEMSSLVLNNEAEQLATPEDQRNAARLLAESSIIEKLGPIGEWNVVEGLLKATIVPNLPANVLGGLYNQLTVASWRQSKIGQADIYNKKAEEIGHRSGDKSVLAGALLSKGNILAWRGKTSQAITVYKDCLDLERFIDPKTIGSTFSNLGAVFYEAGDLNAGEHYQKSAIEIFTFHGKPMNLSIAWCHLAIIYLQKDENLEAKQACDSSVALARQDDYRRGLHMGKLIDAEIHAKCGQLSEARQALSDGLNGFTDLAIEEGLNYEFAGRVSRILGEHQASAAYLKKGIGLSKDFPMYLANLHMELARTLLVASDPSEARRSARMSADLYEQCEAPIRMEMARKLLESIG